MTKATEIEKTDLYREKSAFFGAGKTPQLVELEEASFLVIDGIGSPDDAAFQVAVGALYKVVYTLKFACKRRGLDFKVPTFEGDWWADGADSYEAAQAVPREHWRWTLFMMLPDFVSADDVTAIKAEILAKGDSDGVERIRFSQFAPGKCVQVLHVGPYADEPRTIAEMAAFMKQEGLVVRGHHHEVYLGDPRRAKPETLKTLLRQPVA